ncbi:unnamed protein product [Paramecium sonneborni]|uniref:WD40-repeat-containing domain n=1 Tax=Paramecium sonneborni TaxID=65129 RepID=A0A8S1PLX9_9CILI|nr:unnamed protein product [Paramecium sonneborni]
MNKPIMIENEKDFQCQNKHDQPILLVALDPKLDKKQRFLCNQCIENKEQDVKTIEFKKIIQLIEDKQESKISNQENLASQTIQKLQTFITITQQLMSQYIKLFESIIRIAQDWNEHLSTQRKQCCEYSFYEELDRFIKNSDVDNINLIDNINRSWMTKLYNNLEIYIQDKDKLNLNELKFQFTNIIQKKQPSENKIKLKLIDQSVKQSKRCRAIAFDASGSIMVSTEDNDIKIWSFINGTIKLINTLQGHSDWINCLIYSQKNNSFISGSYDKTIRCWKQGNQNKWISSQPYKQHRNLIMCIIMNSNENTLFSGGFDKAIKVWRVDFNQNELTYLYSLEKHNNKVTALSLNQSENQLVSCAEDKNQIIIWERKQQDKFEFKYYVTQSIQYEGLKFIWINGGKEIDKLYVFELKEGKFQENSEKTIQLITNNQKPDEYRFPIIYNQERNQILVRHKKYIYLIREMNDGKFKIFDQVNFETIQIFGTATNNGKYLFSWDDKNLGYSIYEL